MQNFTNLTWSTADFAKYQKTSFFASLSSMLYYVKFHLSSDRVKLYSKFWFRKKTFNTPNHREPWNHSLSPLYRNHTWAFIVCICSTLICYANKGVISVFYKRLYIVFYYLWMPIQTLLHLQGQSVHFQVLVVLVLLR